VTSAIGIPLGRAVIAESGASGFCLLGLAVRSGVLYTDSAKNLAQHPRAFLVKEGLPVGHTDHKQEFATAGGLRPLMQAR